VEPIPFTLCTKRLGEAHRSSECREFESKESSRNVISVRISLDKVGEVRESSEKSKKNSIKSNEFESQRTSAKPVECRKQNRGNRANSKIDERRRMSRSVIRSRTSLRRVREVGRRWKQKSIECRSAGTRQPIRYQFILVRIDVWSWNETISEIGLGVWAQRRHKACRNDSRFLAQLSITVQKDQEKDIMRLDGG
jgi:hypothetical protein